MPNEVGNIMKDDKWHHFRNISKLHVFIDNCISSPASVCLIFVVPLLKQQWPELAEFDASWHDVTTYSKTQTLFCTDSQSNSSGVVEAGTLKLDLKCRYPIFFLRIPFYTLQLWLFLVLTECQSSYKFSLCWKMFTNFMTFSAFYTL